MNGARAIRVAAAPEKPLMLFDGDCGFCRRWIERWREITRGAVDFAPFQERAAQFPEIARDNFGRAVHLIGPDGEVCTGAAAVFRALAYAGGIHWIWNRAYQHAAVFAGASEFAYSIIARHREAASTATNVLWGADVRAPTYRHARNWFLRALGVVYLIAFVSLWMQVDGLIGSHGILPINELLTAAREQLGLTSSWQALPTLCWWNASDGFLHFLCGAGALLSALLICGIAPVPTLTLLFVAYLSLTVAGQTFLSFQWDVLLLETGFLAIFFAPLPWWPIRGHAAPVSRIGLLGLKALLFKLMIMSAVVKLTSGDPAWWDLTALDFHYETQPLPTPLAWWAHQSPSWIKQLSTLAMYVAELVAPFLIWGPRHARLVAGTLLFGLQLAIAATGNYGFFNLLTASLCLLLVDDAAWPWARPTSRAGISSAQTSGFRALRVGAVAVLITTLPINAAHLVSAFKPDWYWPRPVAAIYSRLEPFRIVNGYGLFRMMTKTRPEIVVEGSRDGTSWQPYEFRWKPGNPARLPRWVAPYQPRLDWQMWFAALGSYTSDRWFVLFAQRLLENDPAVTSLLARNPFTDTPPKFVRATLYEYRFTTRAERAGTGDWWHRELRGEYLPAVSLPER